MGKKRKHNPFQQLDVEKRLHEIFDGKVCHVCGAQAARLRAYQSSTLPDKLVPQNYFCQDCYFSGGKAEPRPGRVAEPITPMFPDSGEEGSEPFYFTFPTVERERLHKEVDGCAYGEYAEELIKPTSKYVFNVSWADRKAAKRQRGLVRQYERLKEKRRLEREERLRHEEFLRSMPKVPVGTGLYIQIGDITFPWRVYHDS